jgi:hypothetical protein
MQAQTLKYIANQCSGYRANQTVGWRFQGSKKLFNNRFYCIAVPIVLLFWYMVCIETLEESAFNTVCLFGRKKVLIQTQLNELFALKP